MSEGLHEGAGQRASACHRLACLPAPDQTVCVCSRQAAATSPMCPLATLPGGTSSSCPRRSAAPPFWGSTARTGIPPPAWTQSRCGWHLQHERPWSAPRGMDYSVKPALLPPLAQMYAVRTPAAHPVHENHRAHVLRQVLAGWLARAMCFLLAFQVGHASLCSEVHTVAVVCVCAGAGSPSQPGAAGSSGRAHAAVARQLRALRPGVRRVGRRAAAEWAGSLLSRPSACRQNLQHVHPFWHQPYICPSFCFPLGSRGN